MRVRLPNFGEVNTGGIPPWMRGAEFGMNVLGKSSDILSQALKQQAMQQEMPYIQKMKEQQLQQALLANKMNEAKAQYAEPMAQAQLQGLQQRNEFNPQLWQSQMEASQANTRKTNEITPLEVEKLKQQNKFYPELMQSQMRSNEALANFRNMGGAQAGVGQKEMSALQRQLQIDHPDWDFNKTNEAASAYLSGEKTFSNGEPLPKISGLARSSIAQIQKRNSTAAVQNQAANMDILSSELNSIDIAPVAKFAGLRGRADVAKYTADMGLGREVPQEFRDYLTFKDTTSNFAMDSLRKGFGTSVVPEYVYATLGKASNPASTWWHDPKQVYNDWNQTKKWINDNAKKYQLKANQGVSAVLESEKYGGKSGNRSSENDPLGIR